MNGSNDSRPMDNLHEDTDQDEEVLRKILEARNCPAIVDVEVGVGAVESKPIEQEGDTGTSPELESEKGGRVHQGLEEEKKAVALSAPALRVGVPIPHSTPGAHSIANPAHDPEVALEESTTPSRAESVEDGNTAVLTDTSRSGSSRTAEPVADEVSDDDLQVAEEVVPRASGSGKQCPSSCPSKKKCARLFMVLLVLAGGTAVVILVALAPWGSSTKTLNATTTAFNATSHIMALLPNYTIDTITKEPNSSQTFAMEWISKDPLLETYPDWRLRQRYALATIFHATGGPSSWKDSDSWLSYELHECEWSAKPIIGEFSLMIPSSRRHLMMKEFLSLFKAPFPCEDNPDGVYRHFWQWTNGLNGSLPPEVALLPSLRTISAYRNPSLSGSLPSTLGLLTNMVGIHLGLNDMMGTIPTQVSAMSNLIFFFLSNNSLRGTLPTELGLLSNLLLFSAEENQLIGSLPTELGQTPMGWMYVGDNALTGPIPSEIGNLKQLRSLDLSSCQLSGSLPTELGNLTRLKDLDLQDNKLSSAIPTQLGNLQNLKYLSLDFNDLSGTIPEALEDLASLEELRLDRNPLLSGTIPSSLCSLEELSMDCSTTLCGCNCTCEL